VDPQAGIVPAQPAQPDPQPDPLSRLRALQVISIALVLGGVAMVAAAIVLRGGRSDTSLPADLAIYLGFLALGGAVVAVIGQQ
jgi:hypothetical protein